MTPLLSPPPRWAWSAEKWAWWFRLMETHVDALGDLVLSAYPEGREEHMRARWTVIRLRAFLTTLRVALSVVPLRA